MRGARRLLVLAVVLILGVIGGSYYARKARQAREAPPPPAVLPPNINATSTDWVHTQDVGGKIKVEIRAHKMRQISEPSEFELEGVELHVYQADEKTYDRIRSSQASFDIKKGTLYSKGAVEITVGVPANGPSKSNLLTIRSSSVHFDTATGKATTDRATSFTFDRGEGQCAGASYDSTWGEVRMQHDVKLRWHPDKPGESSLEVEAGQLIYKEDDSRVYLSPWSRFRQGPLTVKAADSTVTLEDGAIRTVEAHQALGHDEHLDRQTDFAAGLLIVHFTPTGAMEKIVGQQEAKVVSATNSAEMTVTAKTIFLNFKPAGEESFLDNVVAIGNSVLRNRPLPGKGRQLPATRVLRSRVIKAIMRPDGEQIKSLETGAPGTVEFLPNRPGQRRRRLEAVRFWMHYGENNQLQSVRAVKCRTFTEGTVAGAGQVRKPASTTESDDLLAQFDPITGEMTKLEQWGHFQYQETRAVPRKSSAAGAKQSRAGRARKELQPLRKAKADRAVFEPEHNLITLIGNARVWDQAGSTAAGRIVLDQAKEMYTATGKVAVTRMPGPGTGSGGLLTADEPTHATAKKMVVTAGGAHIVYEGNAVLWQGPNRLQARRIEIDRARGTLTATGDVVSQLLDRRTRSKENSAGIPTEVRARKLVYSDAQRVAHYFGKVTMIRPELVITADQLTGHFLKESTGSSPNKSGSTLDYAVADGNVKIVRTSGARTRTGYSQHAEYFTAKDMIILRGGRPRMIDSGKGTVQGNQLTYFASNDRLLVEGKKGTPAVSRLHR